MTNDKLQVPVSIGSKLTAVEYELFPWESSPTITDAVDEVSVAIILRFELLEELRFYWSMTESEGSLAIGPWAPGQPIFEKRIEDVTDRWHRVVGAELSAVVVSYQDREATKSPWACRLEFSSGASLVIALGELIDGVPFFLPDALVVTGSSRIAQAYQPAESSSTAWGEVQGFIK